MKNQSIHKESVSYFYLPIKNNKETTQKLEL
jgi:ribosomal protein L33